MDTLEPRREVEVANSHLRNRFLVLGVLVLALMLSVGAFQTFQFVVLESYRVNSAHFREEARVRAALSASEPDLSPYDIEESSRVAQKLGYSLKEPPLHAGAGTGRGYRLSREEGVSVFIGTRYELQLRLHSSGGTKFQVTTGALYPPSREASRPGNVAAR